MSNARYDERTRGVTVKVLDMTTIHDHLAASAREQKDPTIEKVSTVWDWALGYDAAGVPHLICSEGVEFDFEDGNVKLDIYDKTERPVPGEEGAFTFDAAPFGQVTISLAELEALPHEDQDLADFVRRFGARLERNFDICLGTLAAD